MPPLTEHQIETLHLACLNWRRWSRPGGAGPARCGSIEGRYLPEKLTEEAAKERNLRPATPVNPQEAERVEAAVVALLANSLYIEHRMITLMYLDGLSIRELAQRFSMGEHETTALWHRALSMVQQHLPPPAESRRRCGPKPMGAGSRATTTGSAVDTRGHKG